MTAGILLGWENFASASTYNQIADSSVGKEPSFVIASAVGGLPELEVWDRLSRSVSGKLPSAVLSEGPPPRSRTALVSNKDAAKFFYVYGDNNSRFNHFQQIGYMGDRQDVRVDEQSLDDPADGRTCIKITYVPSVANERQGWAGVYWLDPKANWGSSSGGYDLSNMTRLTFWARGEKGGEQIALFKVGGIEGTHADTGAAVIGPIWLTKEWQHYVIDLRDADLSKVSGGFAWSTSASDNEGPLAFYLDEIRYEH
jgi:hypothetical protein